MKEIVRSHESWTGDTLETYEIVDGEVVVDPYLYPYENRVASKLYRALVLADPSECFGSVIRGSLFVLKDSPKLWRRPDLGFVSQQRWPAERQVHQTEAWEVVPDLVAEIVSQADSAKALLTKLDEYFAAGVRLVWVIYPDLRKIYAYDSPTNVKILQDGDDLDGDPILPGFRFPVIRLFPTSKDGPTPVA